MSDNSYQHLECFVLLGTHFEPRRGQISHTCICDIIALSVKTTYVVWSPFKLPTSLSSISTKCTVISHSYLSSYLFHYGLLIHVYIVEYSYNQSYYSLFTPKRHRYYTCTCNNIHIHVLQAIDLIQTLLESSPFLKSKNYL